MFKQITLITLILFMGHCISAQQIETVDYSETDSLQDVMLKQLEQQLKSINYKFVEFRQEQQDNSDSLERLNTKLAEQLKIQAEESEDLDKKLQQAEAEIERNDRSLLESNKKFKTALFISIPALFIMSIVLAVLLFSLVQKNKSKTDFQINALRKYTLDELEDVKASYVDEIKRRVKKIAAKLRKKEKVKSKKL